MLSRFSLAPVECRIVDSFEHFQDGIAEIQANGQLGVVALPIHPADQGVVSLPLTEGMLRDPVRSRALRDREAKAINKLSGGLYQATLEATGQADRLQRGATQTIIDTTTAFDVKPYIDATDGQPVPLSEPPPIAHLYTALGSRTIHVARVMGGENADDNHLAIVSLMERRKLDAAVTQLRPDFDAIASSLEIPQGSVVAMVTNARYTDQAEQQGRSGILAALTQPLMQQVLPGESGLVVTTA
jgi:hypothetical protein